MRRKVKSKVRPIAIGQRVRVRCNGMSWSGESVPIDTIGTVYVHPRSPRMLSVHFDGFDQLQKNGYPFGIGAYTEKPFMPDWLEAV